MEIRDFIFPFTKKGASGLKSDGIAIQFSEEQLKQEKQKCEEIAENTISEAKESGYFKDDFLSIFAEKIYSISKVGYGYTDPFDKNDFLTLEEKKSLNLNARAKYPRELINGLTEKGLGAAKNRDFIKNMFLRNFHKVSRKYELSHLKESGCKYVTISNSGDERDCKAIKRLKKHWPIDEVPELPLSNCNSEYCRCCYIADEKELMD